MSNSTKLASAKINGRKVDFFEPPHAEPDFPWVNALQLAKAFLPKGDALGVLKSAQRFDNGKAVKVISHNGNLITIIHHSMAQGLCSAIDATNVFNDKCNGDNEGPRYSGNETEKQSTNIRR